MRDWDRPANPNWWMLVVILVLVFVATVMEWRDFPWNGNPFAWYSANTRFLEHKRQSDLHNVDEARARLNEAIRTFPGDKRFYRALAKLEEGQCNFNAAEAAWRKYLHVDRQDIDAWLSLGDLCERTRHFVGEANCAQEVLKMAPSNPEAHALLALALAEQDKMAQAKETISKLDKEPKQTALVWNLLGRYYARTNDPQAAAAALQESVQLAPTNSYFQAFSGSFFLSQNNFEQAQVCLKRATMLNPDDANVWRMLARAYYELHQPDQAIAALAQRAKLQPKDNRALEELGKLQLSSNHADDAVESFKRETELVPENNGAWDLLINSLVMANRYPEAKIAVTRFMNLSAKNSENPVAWKYVGQICEHEGNKDQAKAAYKRAISLSPSAHLTTYCKTQLELLGHTDTISAKQP